MYLNLKYTLDVMRHTMYIEKCLVFDTIIRAFMVVGLAGWGYPIGRRYNAQM